MPGQDRDAGAIREHVGRVAAPGQAVRGPDELAGQDVRRRHAATVAALVEAGDRLGRDALAHRRAARHIVRPVARERGVREPGLDRARRGQRDRRRRGVGRAAHQPHDRRGRGQRRQPAHDQPRASRPDRRDRARRRRDLRAQRVLAIAQLHVVLERGLAHRAAREVIDERGLVLGRQAAVQVRPDAIVDRHRPSSSDASSARSRLRARSRRVPTVALGMFCAAAIAT